MVRQFAVDNITTLQVGNTTLGGLTTIGGNTYSGSAPSVTIAAPTARTIAATLQLQLVLT